MSRLIPVKPQGKTVKGSGCKFGRVPYQLNVGKIYTLCIGPRGRKWSSVNRVRFIQTTPKGFNFLDVKTNTYVLKSPLYKSNFSGYKSKDIFLVVSTMFLYQETAEQYTATDKAMRSDIIRRHAMSSPTVKER